MMKPLIQTHSSNYLFSVSNNRTFGQMSLLPKNVSFLSTSFLLILVLMIWNKVVASKYHTLWAFACSKLTIETLEQGVKYVQMIKALCSLKWFSDGFKEHTKRTISWNGLTEKAQRHVFRTQWSISDGTFLRTAISHSLFSLKSSHRRCSSGF